MSRPLFDYQVEAVEKTIAAFARIRSGLLVLATGLGKTVIFATVAKRMASAGRILVLESGEELVEQTAKEVQSWAELPVGIEMAERTCRGADPEPRVVVASVASLCRPERLQAYDPSRFALVVVDEAHHALADSYQVILDHFRACKLLGVTATPDRLDRQALGQVFEEVLFTLGLEEGIRLGRLVPVRQMKVIVEKLDFTGVRLTAGDLNGADLEKILLDEAHLHAIAAPTLEHAGARPTLVFAASVRHAHELSTLMNRLRPGSAAAIDGSADAGQRQEVTADFRSGKVQFLVNCGLFLEGFNEPPIACVAIARPTASRARYCQMLGRGTRPSPATGKRDLLVLDFAGNAGRHSLVDALDILGGVMEPRIRELAQQAAGEGLPVLEAIERARTRAEVELETRRREEELADANRRGVIGRVCSLLQEIVTGFAFYDFDPRTVPRSGARPRAKQVRALREAGFSRKQLEPLDREQAAALLRRVEERSPRLCNREEARFLAGYGVDARRMSAQGARRIIATIERNGWEPPPEAECPVSDSPTHTQPEVIHTELH